MSKDTSKFKTPLLDKSDGATDEYELSADLSPTALKAFFNNIVHLPQYYDTFVNNNYNSLKILKHLDDNDLIDMDIDNPDHRRRILNAVASFDSENFDFSSIPPMETIDGNDHDFVDIRKSLSTSPKKRKNSKELWSNKEEYEDFINQRRRSSIIDIEAIATSTGGGGTSHNNGNKRLLSKDMTKMSDADRSQYIQELRSEGNTKWYILLCFVFVKSAAILNVLAVSSLEHTMLTSLNLTNSEFALLTSLVFITAAPFSLIVPYIIDKIKVYKTSVIAQTLLTFGQILFVFGCNAVTGISWGTGVGLMYTSRLIFGCGFAMVQICTYTVVSLWFGQSKWNSFALVIIGQTVEIGILMARYTVLPLYSINDSFWLAYGIGIIWSAISIGTTYISGVLESNFSTKLEKDLGLAGTDDDDDNNNGPKRKLTEVTLTRDFRQIKEFPLKVWLIMGLIVLGWSNIETFASQMTEPLIIKYNISEWYADVILSASTFVAFTVGPLTGWIAGKFGRITLDIYVFLTQIFFFLGCMIYFIPSTNVIYAWLCVIIYNIGLQTFYGGIFPLLFIECPAYLVAVANSVNAFAYLVGGFAESLIFGVLGDDSGNWYASMGMVAGVSVVSIFIAIVYVRT